MNKAYLLNDVCELIVDCEHKTAPTQETGYPSIRTPNIGRGNLILDKVKRVSEETYKKWTKRAIPKTDDLILAREAPVGNVAIIPRNLKVCLGQRTVLIRPNKNKIHSHYLCYLLLGDEVQGKISSLSNGATVHHLNMGDIRNLELPQLPPLHTQSKIAFILSAYDDLIENNTRRIKILESMAQTIYQEWFVKFRFPGHKQVKMVKSDLGLIPEGWEVYKLGNITTEIIDYRGKTPKKLGSDWSDSGVMAISAKNIKQGRLVSLEKSKFVDEQLYKKWMKSELQQGDILMTSEAPLGELYYLVEYKKFCLSQRVYGIRANPEVIKPDILYCSLSSNVIQEQIYARRSGTTVLGIRQTELRKVPVIVPPMNIQISASRILNDLFSSVENLQQKNINLRLTRDLLLPKLISGQIDVENLDIDTGELAA